MVLCMYSLSRSCEVEADNCQSHPSWHIMWSWGPLTPADPHISLLLIKNVNSQWHVGFSLRNLVSHIHLLGRPWQCLCWAPSTASKSLIIQWYLADGEAFYHNALVELATSIQNNTYSAISSSLLQCHGKDCGGVIFESSLHPIPTPLFDVTN